MLKRKFELLTPGDSIATPLRLPNNHIYNELKYKSSSLELPSYTKYNNTFKDHTGKHSDPVPTPNTTMLSKIIYSINEFEIKLAKQDKMLNDLINRTIEYEKYLHLLHKQIEQDNISFTNNINNLNLKLEKIEKLIANKAEHEYKILNETKPLTEFDFYT